MPTTILNLSPGTIIRYSTNGDLTKYAADTDTDIARGQAFIDAHSELVTGDSLYVGPGRFAIDSSMIGINDTSIIGCGSETIITALVSPLRYKVRDGQTFSKLTFRDAGRYLVLEPADQIDVGNILIDSCDFEASSDCIITEANNNTIERLWTLRNSSFVIKPDPISGFGDDAVRFGGDFLRVRAFNCIFKTHAPGNIILNAGAFEIGGSAAAPNTQFAHLYNCYLEASPEIQPQSIRGVTCVQVAGDAVCRLHHCDLVTIDSGFTNVWSLQTINSTSVIQAANCVLDLTRINNFGNGTIESIESPVS
jgi:hypothetical protein